MARRKKHKYTAVTTVGAAVLLAPPAYFVWRWIHANWEDVVATAAIVAVVMLAGAVTLAALRQRRRSHERARQETLTYSIDVTDAMNGTEFEHWTAALLRRCGFDDVVVCGKAGDRGADVIANTANGARVVIQCKRYAAHRSVGSAEVYQFAGTARTLHGAQLAIFITTAKFTKPARRDAEELGITLVDRHDLAVWATDGTPPFEHG